MGPVFRSSWLVCVSKTHPTDVSRSPLHKVPLCSRLLWLPWGFVLYCQRHIHQPSSLGTLAPYLNPNRRHPGAVPTMPCTHHLGSCHQLSLLWKLSTWRPGRAGVGDGNSFLFPVVCVLLELPQAHRQQGAGVCCHPLQSWFSLFCCKQPWGCSAGFIASLGHSGVEKGDTPFRVIGNAVACGDHHGSGMRCVGWKEIGW